MNKEGLPHNHDDEKKYELIRNIEATSERIAQERGNNPRPDARLTPSRTRGRGGAAPRGAVGSHEEARGATARHAVALEAARRALRDLEARERRRARRPWGVSTWWPTTPSRFGWWSGGVELAQGGGGEGAETCVEPIAADDHLGEPRG